MISSFQVVAYRLEGFLISFYNVLSFFSFYCVTIYVVEPQEGWCDSRGTIQEVKAKIQMRQEGAFKRDRALAYSHAQKVYQLQILSPNILLLYVLFPNNGQDLHFCTFSQQWKSIQNSHSRTNISIASRKNEFSKDSLEWSWLERWMAAKPWENRLMEEIHSDPLESTPPPKPRVSGNIKSNVSKSSEPCSVKVRKNNITTRISAKPFLIAQTTRSSSSPSSEFYEDNSSASPSFPTSTTPFSRNTNMSSNRTDDNSSVTKPGYMNLTETAKAKQINMSHRALSRPGNEFEFFRKTNNIW